MFRQVDIEWVGRTGVKLKKRVRFACPLDCFDACGLIATVDNGRVVKVQGDPDHPLTQGKICPKGKKHLTRLYAYERLTHPLKRFKGQFVPVAWDEILDEIRRVAANKGEANGLARKEWLDRLEKIVEEGR